MSAVVLQNTKRKEYHCLYKLFCMIVVFFHLVYRCARKCCKGKVTGRLQPVLSVLALSCITSVCLLPSALDKGMISLGQAGLFSILLLLGFGCFAGMAGAFRPYRYMKKKQKFASRSKILTISDSASERSTKTA
ncbi:MAG: hypothetical protein KHW79_08305 [Clostridiales bacterium]|nr:hypothetical protein [Clostridiales bacterium]